MRRWLLKLRRWTRWRDSPHRLALAFGLGVALGVIPGTGAILAAGVAMLARLNLAAMVTGALLTNPITGPFVYTGSYFLGRWLLGDWLPDGKIPRILVGSLTGNVILAVAMGVTGYGLVWLAATMVRKRRASRMNRPE